MVTPLDAFDALNDAIAIVEAGDRLDIDALRAVLDTTEAQLFDAFCTDELNTEERQATATVARFVRDSAPVVDLLAAGDALGAEVAMCRAMGFPSLQIPNDAADLAGGTGG